MGESMLTETDEIEYLGVIIDNQIAWIPHITYVKNKVLKGIGILFKTGNYLKRNALINLYHSYHTLIRYIAYKHWVMLLIVILSNFI